MTPRIDVEDGAARRPDIVAEVEAGRDVVVARGAMPVAISKREPHGPSREEVAAAITEIEETRRGIPPTTAEAILARRDEGRR